MMSDITANRTGRSSLRSLAFAALALCAAMSAAAAGASEPIPQRVVSMNLCTDQMAMLIAGEGQLHSVSYLASDPESSVLVSEAAAFAVNHGLAEEIFVMRPDLVVAGTFTSRASIAMLRRLGFRVEEFPPAYSFDEIREQMRRMGRLLGREGRAEELVRELDRRLAEASAPAAAWRPLAALYYANSYTSGSGTLANAIVERAGLENLGSRLGLAGTVRLPLEVLVLATPDLVVDGLRRGRAPALAYEAFEHPALSAVLKGRTLTPLPDKYWVCGAPFTAEAVRLLSTATAAVRAQGWAQP